MRFLIADKMSSTFDPPTASTLTNRLIADIADPARRAGSYLLCGPEGGGKWQTAKILAQRLQCPNGFCRSCEVCSQIESGSHPDTKEWNGPLEESLKIGELRNLIAWVNTTPQGNLKVILIRHLERMTLETANGFLKTLEEPPDNTVFITTAINRHDLPPTLISRLRVYSFSDASTMVTAENEEETKRREKILEDLAAGRALAEAFLYLEEITADKKKTLNLLKGLALFFRSRLFRNGEKTPLVEETMIGFIEETEKIFALRKNNVNVRLFLEGLFLSVYVNAAPQ